MRTIRFDATDERVFERAAGPDEWAVSGAFAFTALDRSQVVGKLRQAFAHGFLSLHGFGRSSFVTICDAPDGLADELALILADHLIDAYGAPDRDAALPAAREEIDFAAGLCRDAPVNTVLSVSREFDEDGSVREVFRSVRPPAEAPHARIWDVVPE